MLHSNSKCALMFRTCDPVNCTLLSSADSVWSKAPLLLVFSSEGEYWIISCHSHVLSGNKEKRQIWALWLDIYEGGDLNPSRSICGPSQCGSGSACLTPWVSLLQSNNILQTMRTRTQFGDACTKYGCTSNNRIHGRVRSTTTTILRRQHPLRDSRRGYHLPCHRLVLVS
jgi:hypothetical protein